MVYHARPADANVHQNTADAVLVALGDAKGDLQSLFDGTSLEHNLALLRRHATFGHDFIPGWMLFILFLYRALMFSRRGFRHVYFAAGFILLATWATNSFLTTALGEADRQAAVTDAMLTGIYFQRKLKWIFFFSDALLGGFCLFKSPPVVRIGAVILAVSSLAGFAAMVIPFPGVMPYCVLGLFMGFTGLSILLLFNPQFLLPSIEQLLA
jgi:hypothetical protein